MAKKKKKANKSSVKPMSDKRFISEKARTFPVYGCYVVDDWQNDGLTNVIVARDRGGDNLCFGMFLCDTWCMGVKGACGRVSISKDDFKREVLGSAPKFKECDYTYAHNLVYGAEAFAADAGIDPHPDFDLWGKILEEDTEDIPLVEIEFGDKGKYHLIAERGSREALYARALKERLGDDFIFDIGYGTGVFDPGKIDDFDDDSDAEYDDDDDFDTEYDDDDDAPYSGLGNLFGENAPESIEELLERMVDGFKMNQEEDNRHPMEVYSYQHPSYPDRLELKHKFIADEFRKPTNGLSLPTKVINRILALPEDEVVDDISRIIMYTIGKTWKAIDEDTLEWTGDYTLIHSLAFLTQIGDEAGLEAVMEVTRQNNAFREFHMGDADCMIIPNAIYATGRNRTDVLEDFLKHPGYEGYAKGFVSDALSFIATEEPARRGEIIEIYRRYLNFMQENIPSQNGCSGYVAGFIMSCLIDLKAEELLPEIKRLYDSGYVNLNICGSYDMVEEDIKSDKDMSEKYDFTDIKDLYSRLQEVFGH